MEIDKKEIPEEYICPITGEIMMDPVFCSDGVVFEKRAIQKKLMMGDTINPLTNLPLKSTSFTQSSVLKQDISFFREAQARIKYSIEATDFAIQWEEGFYFGEMCMEAPNGVGWLSCPQGHKYFGNWLNGMRNGKMTVFFSNGDIYEGDWVKNEPHGMGKMLLTDGLLYSGAWRNGARHGHGVQEWLQFSVGEGCRYEGQWKKNLKDGIGKQKEIEKGESKDILIEYEGSWKKDKKEGHGLQTWSKKQESWSEWKVFKKYEGQWRNNEYHGKGTLWIQGYKLYEGHWKKGFKHGQGIQYESDGPFFGIWEYNQLQSPVYILQY